MGCGTPGCGGPPTCGNPCPPGPRDQHFTVQTPQMFSNSLARLLVGPADKLRNLYTTFGLRPYIVRLVRTRWSGGARNRGEESVIGTPELLLPTPLILDLLTLTPIVSPIGSDERGGILLTEVSGCYTEEHLRGLDDVTGAPIPADQSFYYEVQFLRADGAPGEFRRFNANSAPTFVADDFLWQVKLERSRPDRIRATGSPR